MHKVLAYRVNLAVLTLRINIIIASVIQRRETGAPRRVHPPEWPAKSPVVRNRPFR
jgi:hypothetical protein